MFFNKRHLHLFCPVPVALILLLAACAGGVREPAPGASLPGLQVYDAGEAAGPAMDDPAAKLKVLVVTSELSDGLRKRFEAALKCQCGEGATTPWEATFESGTMEEARALKAKGFTHILNVTLEDTALRVKASVIEEKGERQTGIVLLALAARKGQDDGGVDFLPGRALRTRELPAPGLTADARKQLNELIRSLGMGTLRVYSAAIAEVYLEEKGALHLLGNTPLETQLRAGGRSLLLRRKGQPEQRLRLRVEDGQERGLFARWADDADPGSLMVFTSPAGLRLAMNGEILGDSPVARPGLPRGSYDIEVVRQDGAGEGRILTTDHIEVRNNLRSDRFYPLLYHFRPSGEPLRAALDTGLWSYSSPDRSFAFQDFEKPNVSSGAGIVSAPIGARDLQGELLLSPEGGAIGYYGEKDRFLVFPGKTAVRLQVEHGGNLESYTVPRGKNAQIYLYFEMDPEGKNLLLRVDGSTVYDGDYDAGSVGRLVIVGAESGSLLPEEMLFRSGPEREGRLYRWKRSLWLRGKTLTGSPLRLMEEQ